MVSGKVASYNHDSLYMPINASTRQEAHIKELSHTLGCGHIGVDYSGIRCTFLRAREYLKSNIMISLYRVT